MRKPSKMDEYGKFRDDDPVARLIVHYFYPADLMFQNFQKLRIQLNAGKRAQTIENLSNELSYLKLWFGLLYAVAEGFKELKLYDATLEKLFTEYGEQLRLFRNGTFHFQRSHEKTSQFLRVHAAIEWAEKLHRGFEKFFSEYRSEIAVRAMLADMGMELPEKLPKLSN